MTIPSAQKLPRWRGFNLLNKFYLASDGRDRPFDERDFADIAALGFDFVRLPLDYRTWIVDGDWERLSEAGLCEIDRAVELGGRYGLHVMLNFHRAPGFTVARPPEPRNLWTDPEARRVCSRHWAAFAERYRGIPNERLSFNLVNEPAHVTAEDYAATVRELVAAIRAHDPERLIVADGRDYGHTPNPLLLDLGVAQGMRGYHPFAISHHDAEWIENRTGWPEPAWPLRMPDGTVQDAAWLWDRYYGPWRELEAHSVGLMVGECGAFNRTPHTVVLAWLDDLLGLFARAGWGWCLWNFSGAFGVCDSGRPDVRYETWRGRQLDRAMLEVLQRPR